MLSREQSESAVQYNFSQKNKLYKIGDLPWPWSDLDIRAFVWATALFQKENGLTVDGKLGPKTWNVVRHSVGGEASMGSVTNSSARMRVVHNEEKGNSERSDAIIIGGEHVRLPDELIDQGCTATNYIDDGEPRFGRRRRAGTLMHFVLHETCGNTAEGCKRTLLQKNYGVQLIMDPYGHVSCHGDLILDHMVHANHLNSTSFGIEIVNPYTPIYVVDKDVWHQTIPREWWTWVPSSKSSRVKAILKRRGLSSVPKEYVTPTASQMGAIRALVPWLCEVTGVPYRFPTRDLNKKKRKIYWPSSVPKGVPGPGVVAHRDFHRHADGRYILEDLIARGG